MLSGGVWEFRDNVLGLPFARNTGRMGWGDTNLAELAADVCEALFAVETEGFETAVSEHFDDLSILWKR